MWFQNSHTHTILFPTNWDLRRLETETCWRLLASSSCTTSYCQLPDLRPAATGDFVQHTFLLQEKTSVNKDVKEHWVCSHIWLSLRWVVAFFSTSNAFGQRIRNPQPFRRESICKISRQKLSFLQLRKSLILEALRNLSETSPKPLRKQALWKQALPETADFCWRLNKSLSKMHKLRQYYVSRQNRVY